MTKTGPHFSFVRIIVFIYHNCQLSAVHRVQGIHNISCRSNILVRFGQGVIQKFPCKTIVVNLGVHTRNSEINSKNTRTYLIKLNSINQGLIYTLARVSIG